MLNILVSVVSLASVAAVSVMMLIDEQHPVRILHVKKIPHWLKF